MLTIYKQASSKSSAWSNIEN